jgi:hypothetical protein
MLSFANCSSVAVLFLTIPITVLEGSLANVLIKAYCSGDSLNNLDGGVLTPENPLLKRFGRVLLTHPKATRGSCDNIGSHVGSNILFLFDDLSQIFCEDVESLRFEILR